MEELGVTNSEQFLDAQTKLRVTIEPSGMYYLEEDVIKVMDDFANEKNSELLQRYNEAIEVLENVKRLETLIRYPDDVPIMHEGEAEAIHVMLNDVEQTISKAKME